MDVGNIIKGCYRFEKKFLTEAVVDEEFDIVHEQNFDNTISYNPSLFSPKGSTALT